MKEKFYETIALLLVVAILLLGVGLYFYQSSSLDSTTGFVVTSAKGVQCEDTDNNISLGLGAEQQDSDSIFTRGATRIRTFYNLAWKSASYDECVGSTSGSILLEKSCTDKAKMVVEKVDCLNGCILGRCKLPACTDNDGEFGYFTASNVSGLSLDDPEALGVPGRQTAKIYSDVCTSNSTLTEYYCSGGPLGNKRVLSRNYNCSAIGRNYICDSGRCISQ